MDLGVRTSWIPEVVEWARANERVSATGTHFQVYCMHGVAL